MSTQHLFRPIRSLRAPVPSTVRSFASRPNIKITNTSKSASNSPNGKLRPDLGTTGQGVQQASQPRHTYKPQEEQQPERSFIERFTNPDNIKPSDPRYKEAYKQATRKWTALLIALPVLIVTSGELFRRLVLGQEKKEIPRPSTAAPEVTELRDAISKST